MALELIKDTIKFEQIIGEGQSQMLVDKDIIVPDIKPDIDKLLSVEGKVSITSKDMEPDKVILGGSLNLSVLYSASEEPQPIYAMNYNDSFSHSINIPGAMPKMEPEVKCDIEHINFNKINGRKFNVQCVLNISGKVNDRIPVDAVKEIAGITDVQLLRDTIVTDDIVGDSVAQAVVRGTIAIPENMPAADEILKYRAMIHKKETSIEDGKVVITGCVLVPVLFVSKGDVVDVFRVEEDMVFSHTVEMPGVMPDMACSIDYSVEDVYAELREDEGGEKRQIDVEVVLGFKTKVRQKAEFSVVVDAYAPSSRIEPEIQDVMVDLHFGMNSSQTVVKEALQLPQGLHEMEKIYDMACKPVVTDCKMGEDRVAVEGVLGCDIIYLAKGDERLVQSFTDEVPFKCFIAVPGCREYMKPDVEVDIEGIDFSLLTKNEVEIKVTLECLAKIYEKVSKSFIITAAEAEEEVPVHKASITIYVVQPGDTLWKIAKRYYTTIDDIVKANEFSDPDSLTTGIKLIIPKIMQ